MSNAFISHLRWAFVALLCMVPPVRAQGTAPSSEDGVTVPATTGTTPIRWLVVYGEVNFLDSDKMLVAAGQSGNDFYEVDLGPGNPGGVLSLAVQGTLNELAALDFSADRRLYLLHVNGEVVRTDAEGSPAQLVGNTGNHLWRAMTSDTEGRTFGYASEPHAAPGLYSVDLANATATLLSSALSWNALALGPGEGPLYGVSGRTLCQLDMATGAILETIGAVDRDVVAMDFAWIRNESVLVGVENAKVIGGRHVPTFFRIDTTTAATTDIADAQPFGAVDSPDGIVHAMASIPSRYEHPDWPAGQIPTGASQLARDLEDYYAEMSCGNHVVEVLHAASLVRTTRARIDAQPQRSKSLAQLLEELGGTIVDQTIETNAGIKPLSDFDSWTLGCAAQPKVPPQSNGRIDVLHVVWRNWHPQSGRTEVGHAASGVASSSVAAPASWRPITHFEAVTESVAGSASAVFTILVHEYMHHLFGGNNFHTGSGAGYHTFMAPVGSFSMTAHAPSVSFVACGWDRHRLGWKYADRARLIGAIDPATGNEVPGDLTVASELPRDGVFRLRDFVFRGDALRIALPNARRPSVLTWRSGTAYETGAVLYPGTETLFVCAAIGGTSGSTEPDWSDDWLVPTVDGSVSWVWAMDSGLPLRWIPTCVYEVGDFAVPSSARDGRMFRASVRGVTAWTEPDWPAQRGESVTDGGVTWVYFADLPSATRHQYLWIENHLLRSRFDRNNWAHDPALYDWNPGIYAYVQVGKDDKQSFGEDGSYLFPLTAQGNHDLYWQLDQVVMAYAKTGSSEAALGLAERGSDIIPYTRSLSLPNPFTGCSDVYWQIDSDTIDYATPSNNVPTLIPFGNGLLADRDLRVDPMRPPGQQAVLRFVTEFNGAVTGKLPCYGDGADAFGSASGNKKLYLGSNPAPAPVYTHDSGQDHTRPNIATYTLDDAWELVSPDVPRYGNRTIWLSGLSIEIVGENTDGDGAVDVRVRFDDYRVDRHVRWCGNIVLQNDAEDPSHRQARVIVAAGRQLYLDRGLSPTQYLAWADAETYVPQGHPAVFPPWLGPETGRLFTERSILTLKSGTRLHLEEYATLWVQNGSSLVVEPGAEIVLSGNQNVNERIRTQTGGQISMPPGCVVMYGDVTGDGRVDRRDLLALLENRDQPACTSTVGYRGDLDGDGMVTVRDVRLLVLLPEFRPAGGPPPRGWRR